VHGYKLAAETVLGQAEAARARCATLLNARPEEVMVTHGTADGLAQLAGALDLREGEHLLTSGAEHDSGVLCWRWLARRRGGVLDVVPLPPELTDPAAIVQRFADAMTPRTRAICVSDVIAWTGLRLPLRELAELAHAHGALLIADGAQSLGHVPVDVQALGCDAYAGSGHKWLRGPKGSGILYVAQAAQERLFPVAWEDSKRLNSEAMGGCPLPMAVGLGAAVEEYLAQGPEAVLAHNCGLRAQLLDGVRAVPGVEPLAPAAGAGDNGLLGLRLPDAVDASALRKTLLDRHRINVRLVDKKQWHGLRVSLHVTNPASDVERLLAALHAELG
jgi:selenocysteine lyase/cysteine desulfurase